MKSKDVLLLEQAYDKVKLLREKLLAIDSLRQQIIGAFRTYFDVDEADIDDARTNINDARTKERVHVPRVHVPRVHVPLSKDLGLRDFKIDYDYRLPMKCDYHVSVYFALVYKRLLYIVDLSLYYWNQEPTRNDFQDIAHGRNLAHGSAQQKQKNQISTESPLTVYGYVYEVDPKTKDKILLDTINRDRSSFDHFRPEGGDIGEIAIQVKKIIDNSSNDENDEPEDLDPVQPTSEKTPIDDLVEA